jgi:dTDP-4-amino-4,6-dideoxygalactose transaminase
MGATRSREIGGEFSLPTEYLCRNPTNQFPAYCQYDRHILLTSGRAALKLLARSLKLGRKDEVLLPSYLCKEILKPFREEGVRTTFYKVDDALNADVDDIENKLSKNTKVLLFIHYFGFLQPDTGRIRSLCTRNGTFLIEDLVQSFLTTFGGKPLGAVGDAAISSYRKWIPIPDGALLGVNNAKFHLLSAKKLSRDTNMYVKYRIAALGLKGKYFRQLGISKRVFREAFSAADDFLTTTPVRISAYSRKLLPRFDFDAIIARRRANFERLLRPLSRLKIVRPVHGNLPEGVCPLGFPALVRDRNTVKRLLIKDHIYPPIHWRLPREVSREDFPVSWEVSYQMLTLPIDQRYGFRDMDFVADMLRKIEATG